MDGIFAKFWSIAACRAKMPKIRMNTGDIKPLEEAEEEPGRYDESGSEEEGTPLEEGRISISLMLSKQRLTETR